MSELKADRRDIYVDKHRLSGFWDDELDSILRRREITTLLFAGVNLDCCVLATDEVFSRAFLPAPAERALR